MLRKSRPYEKNTKTKVKLKMRKHKTMEYEHKKNLKQNIITKKLCKEQHVFKTELAIHANLLNSVSELC